MRPAVLVAAHRNDVHVEVVKAALERRHRRRVHTLWMAGFPTLSNGSFEMDAGGSRRWLCDEGVDLPLDDVVSVWWRRPTPCQPPRIFTGLDGGEFVQAECDHFLEGLLWSLDCLWINNPQNDRRGSRKVVQLAAARDVGLEVPRTLVTTRPDEARRFYEQATGRVIFKRVGTSPGPASKTSFLDSSSVAALDAIRASPTIFQDYIEGTGDVRVVWIDGDAWAVHIDSQAGVSPEDCRFDLSVRHVAMDVPDEVAQAIDGLMAKLGLTFGALDFRVSIDGRWIFLEVNPSGQFLWLQERAGVPIAEALASRLAAGRG